ncbi:MAG: sulfotransferase [Acidobacteria bacterium]|nr:sulfotransferase [Acidobacteriota bacterium]
MTEQPEHPDRFHQLVQPPVFIVGAARSGTTWVYDIMSAHPAVAGVYESWLFTPRDGLQSLFSKAHWPFHHSGLGCIMTRDELLAHIRRLSRRLLSHAMEPQHTFLVEKSPNHLFDVPFIQEVFPDARFIHVLRDGRDVSVSVRAAANSWVRPWRDTFGRSIRSSARAWRDAVQRAHEEALRLGERFLELRYEDLHADPRSAYRRLFDFSGIPYDERLLEEIYTVTDFQRNFVADETAFRRGGRTGDWQFRFSLWDAWNFHRLAGHKLLELGYETRRRWWLRQLWPPRRRPSRPTSPTPAA